MNIWEWRELVTETWVTHGIDFERIVSSSVIDVVTQAGDECDEAFQIPETIFFIPRNLVGKVGVVGKLQISFYQMSFLYVLLCDLDGWRLRALKDIWWYC